MDNRLDLDVDLERLSADVWLGKVETLGEEHGYFEPLGDDHFALFLDAGPKLIVTFEVLDEARKAAGGETVGMRYTRDDGWSHLALISREESWFRDHRVYGFFDRLIDDGFFEDFDSVLFYGAHAGGYAAAAFSVAAPGAHVLAIRPQATLDPSVANWDTRYLPQRRQDFTSRYGYAPDMIDAARHVWIAYDPSQKFDAIHAALFTRPNVSALKCLALGWNLDTMFQQMGILDTLIRETMDGTLDGSGFAALIRARRRHPTFQRTLFRMAVRRNHAQLATDMAAHIIRESGDRFFADRLQELRDQGFEPSRPVKTDAA